MARPVTNAVTPMWLAHHFPEDYDRCVRVGRRHICRRCLVLYPLALAVMAVALAADGWAAGPVALGVLVVLPLPAVVEFVAEHGGVLRHRPWRQVLVTVPLAVALGVGFARYLRNPANLGFWAVVVGYSGVCAFAAWRSWGRGAAAGEDG